MQFFGGRGGVEENFLIAIGVTALQGFVATSAGNKGRGQNLKGGEEAKIAEEAEVLLPSGLFGQKGESTFENGLGLQQIVRSDGQKFVTGGEIVDEIGVVALQIVGIAKKYEFHIPYRM